MWPVAQREIVAMLQTKSYWLGCLFFPVCLSALLFMFWISVSSLKISFDHSDMDSLPLLAYEYQFDQIRSFFWGDPLYYYVVDRSDHHIAEAVRLAKVKRDFDVWYGNSSRAPSIEEFQKRLADSDLGLEHPLDYRRFREIQEPDVSIETLHAWIEKGKIVGYFIIPEDVLASNPNAMFVRPSRGGNAHIIKLDELEQWFEDLLTRVRQDKLLETDDIEIELRQPLQASLQVAIDRVAVSPSSDAGRPADAKVLPSLQLPIANWVKSATIPFIYLFILISGTTANVMVTNTIEEKSNRVAEMLAANLNPSQVLDGKLLGNCVVMLIGIGCGCVLIGPPLVLLLDNFSGQEMSITATILHLSKLSTWLIFLIFGVAFFGYIQTALGSLCDDLKELVTVVYPISIIQLFCVIPSIVYVLFNPDGRVTQVISFIPFLTPSVMVSRLASLPTWPVYLAIVLVMVLSIVAIRKFSTSLFAHGMVSERAPRGMRMVFRLARRPV